VLLVAAHASIFAGFFLPWINGAFGRRMSLSGFDLARIAGDASSIDLEQIDEAAMVIRLSLLTLPALAVSGAVAVPICRGFGLSLATGRWVSAGLVLPATVVGGVVLILGLVASISSAASPVVNGPAPGAFFESGGFALAVAALIVGGRGRSGAAAAAAPLAGGPGSRETDARDALRDPGGSS
jgi:hypothetical protein